MDELRRISVAVKSEIKELPLPTVSDIQRKALEKALCELEAQLQGETNPIFVQMVNDLLARGHSLQGIAQAALSLHYGELGEPVTAISQFKHEAGDLAPMEARHKSSDRRANSNEDEKKAARPKARPMDFGIMVVDIGYSSRVNANHIIGAITDRTGISGKEIGKIDISPEQSIVEIPSALIEQVVEEMKGCKICGKPTRTHRLAEQGRNEMHRPRKVSKAAPFSGQLVAKYNTARSSGPIRRKRKIPDFEG